MDPMVMLISFTMARLSGKLVVLKDDMKLTSFSFRFE